MKRITYQKPDLHMHSVYSDGTDTPELLLRNVRAAGLDIFALTDHDTAEGCAAVRALLQRGMDPKGIVFDTAIAAYLHCCSRMIRCSSAGWSFPARTRGASTICWATATM